MKKARLNIATSYTTGDTEDLPEFYSWLKTQLTTWGFDFKEGDPASWQELKELSPSPLTHDSDFPYINFYQG